MLEKDFDIMSNITDDIHYVYTLHITVSFTLFLFLAILFDGSINRFWLKSLNLSYLISIQLIPLKYTGMIEQAIESTYKFSNHSEKIYICTKNHQILLKLYHSLVLHAFSVLLH